MNTKANKRQVNNFQVLSFTACQPHDKCSHIWLRLSLPSGTPATIFRCDAGWFCTLPRDWHSEFINHISTQEISGAPILSPLPTANPPPWSCFSDCALISDLCNRPPYYFTIKYPCISCLQLLKPCLCWSSQWTRCLCCCPRSMATWALQTYWNHGPGLG